MPAWKKHSIFLLIVLLLFFVLSFPMNSWFSLTMSRHQILQLPAMLLLGILTGIIFSKINIDDTSWGLAILILIMFSLIFWMIPRSVDLAVVHPYFNRVMHINMLLAGFFLIAVLRKIIFEIKVAFLGMLSAMLLAAGITLSSFDIQVCSSFNIQQQKDTGFYMIMIGIVVFVATLFTLFSGLGKAKVKSITG